jgi:flagellar hook-length control protein FliK
MAADQAPTRQWLEQALPTLAATLREAGLTLAGGGVFERAPGGQPGDGQGGQGGRGDAAPAGLRTDERDRADAAATAVGAAPVRRRGVVDLVA